MKSKLFIILFLLCAFYTNAQYIIAGQHNANDYYYKYTPDSIVINIPTYQYYPHLFSLDVNNDGIMDFQFALLAPGTALGADEDYCTIRGLNNNKVALAHYDTCFNYVGAYRSRYGMAYKFNYNDTINANANWDSLVYLNYYFYWAMSSDSSGYNCGYAYGTDTAYIGVRIQLDSLYEYGWIKIVGISFNNYYPTTLTMGTFACEDVGVGIKPLTNNNKEITVYPNPANDRINVTSGSGKIILICICNMLGKEMISTTEKEIDVSNLPEGVYFMLVKTSESLFTKKVIIQR